MPLGVYEMECRKCRDYTQTRIEMVLTKNKLVQFQVICDGCGGYSHQLEYDDRNRAVKRFLEKEVYQMVTGYERQEGAE